MSRKQTQEEFTTKCNKIWNNKYDYSKTKYSKVGEYVIITCPQHGDFKQKASNHYYFEGCKVCFAKTQRNKFLFTTDQFIKKSRKIHGRKYNYSKSNYIGNQDKVIIICKKHGEFEQIPYNHWYGCGCPKCGIADHPGAYFNSYFKRYPEKKKRPGHLYFLQFIHKRNNHKFYKIGITTSSIKYRFSGKSYKNFKIKILSDIPMPIFKAFHLEKQLLKENKHLLKPVDYPDFHGRNECFLKPIKIPN